MIDLRFGPAVDVSPSKSTLNSAGPKSTLLRDTSRTLADFVDLEELGGNDLSGRFNQCGAQIDFEIAARLGGRLLRQASRTKGGP